MGDIVGCGICKNENIFFTKNRNIEIILEMKISNEKKWFPTFTTENGIVISTFGENKEFKFKDLQNLSKFKNEIILNQDIINFSNLEINEIIKVLSEKINNFKTENNNKELENCFNNRGLTYFEMKEFSKSLEDYSQAIILNPNNSIYFYNRGFGYFEMKDHIFKNLFLNITHFKLLQFFKYGRGLARFFQFLHPLSGGSSKLTSKSISSCEISVLILNG